MSGSALWKYCTPEHCKQLILSLHLLGDTADSESNQLRLLYTISNCTEKYYSPYEITNVSGSLRRLQVPHPFLKKIQANILHHVLEALPASSSATAYKKGSCITHNASPHLQAPKILKLDIENFFGSIIFPMVYRVFPSSIFPPPVKNLLTQLCCYKDFLPQGAPTSPAISNLILKPFDVAMEAWCQDREITYTRYCDDMTFSGKFDEKAVKNKVQGNLLTMGFSLNKKKSKLLSSGQQQAVTGIVVNKKLQVPKKYRKLLRQEIHYCKKYGVSSHLSYQKENPVLSCNKHSEKQYLHSLLGKINYVLCINPNDTFFVTSQAFVKELLANCLDKENNGKPL